MPHPIGCVCYLCRSEDEMRQVQDERTAFITYRDGDPVEAYRAWRDSQIVEAYFSPFHGPNAEAAFYAGYDKGRAAASAPAEACPDWADEELRRALAGTGRGPDQSQRIACAVRILLALRARFRRHGPDLPDDFMDGDYDVLCALRALGNSGASITPSP